VSLNAGNNRIEARGEFPPGPESDSVEWQLDSALEQSYHIDSGSLIAAGSSAALFGSDAFFSGGQSRSVDKPGGWGRPTEKAPISGTDDRDLAATYREGSFVYRLPVENGKYKVSLRFIEPSMKPGERQFDVLANDERILESFDIAAEAGEMLSEVERSFTVVATDGLIELTFKPVTGEAVVSAVLVDPLDP
jgi:beta-galactosidase